MFIMPTLETPRLSIRSFVKEDLPDAYQLLDVDLRDANLGTEPINTLAERALWLEWNVLNYTQLAKLHQPPYGDRAIILRTTRTLIGACGFVPCLNTFEQLPSFQVPGQGRSRGLYSTEFGLFWAISPAHQNRGYATEAARALSDYAFQHLCLRRVIAETDYDNAASMAVMRKLGMRIEKNPLTEPPWLQVVGILENPSPPA